MEDGEDEPGDGAGAGDQQPEGNGAVEGRAGPAHRVGQPRLGHERADERGVGVVREPDREGLGLEQPVGVELGDAGEEVERGDLRAEQPDRADGYLSVARARIAAGVERPRAVDGQRGEQEAGEGEPVVMIEVGGLVDQFDVGEADGEEEHGGAGADAEDDGDGEEREGGEVEVHPRGGPSGDPLEAGVLEVMCWGGVELIDPAVGEEADDRGEADCAEGDAEDGCGCAVDGAGGARGEGVDRAPGPRARNRTRRKRRDAGDHGAAQESPSLSEKPTEMPSRETTSVA